VPFSGYRSVVCCSFDHYSLKRFFSGCSAAYCGWFDLSLNAPFSDYQWSVVCCCSVHHSLKKLCFSDYYRYVVSCSFGPSSVVLCE